MKLYDFAAESESIKVKLYFVESTYSEDMQDGQIIEGKLKISNPFVVETLE